MIEWNASENPARNQEIRLGRGRGDKRWSRHERDWRNVYCGLLTNE